MSDPSVDLPAVGRKGPHSMALGEIFWGTKELYEATTQEKVFA